VSVRTFLAASALLMTTAAQAQPLVTGPDGTWTTTNGSSTWTTGVGSATFTGGGSNAFLDSPNFNITNGLLYSYTYTVANVLGNPNLGFNFSGTPVPATSPAVAGTFTQFFTANLSGSTTFRFIGNGGAGSNFDIQNASVSLVTPEVNASAACLPLAGMALLLAGVWERRRRVSVAV